MRPMMLDVVKPRAQSRRRNSERSGQIIFQIAHLSRVAQTIYNLTRQSITISSGICGNSLSLWERVGVRDYDRVSQERWVVRALVYPLTPSPLPSPKGRGGRHNRRQISLLPTASC